MSGINDKTYAVYQGKVSAQQRQLNGAPIGGFVDLLDTDKMEITIKQTKVKTNESRSGLGLLRGVATTQTDFEIAINILEASKPNLALAAWGTDTSGGGVAAGSASAELAVGYNNTKLALNNPNVSSLTAILGALDVNMNSVVGESGAIATIAATSTTSTGYTASALLPLTLTPASGTPVAATAFAITNAAGAIVGAYVVPGSNGSGYVGPVVATVTTPGGGTGASFQVNLVGATLVAGTDYTLNTSSGVMTILPGSLIVPAYVDLLTLVTPGSFAASINSAYSYGAYAGTVEAMTHGVKYYTFMLEGTNVENNQSVITKIYQVRLDMQEVMALIEKKVYVMTLKGDILVDTTLPDPSLSNPYSNIMKTTKV